jgi:hypothetical protein
MSTLTMQVLSPLGDVKKNLFDQSMPSCFSPRYGEVITDGETLEAKAHVHICGLESLDTESANQSNEPPLKPQWDVCSQPTVSSQPLAAVMCGQAYVKYLASRPEGGFEEPSTDTVWNGSSPQLLSDAPLRLRTLRSNICDIRS